MCYPKLIITFLLIPTLIYANDEFLSPVVSSHEKIAHLLTIKNPDSSSIIICYNYSCDTNSSIHISAENIASIKAIFQSSNRTGHDERSAIAQAIALLEKISATQTPVYNDKAKNYNDNNLPGRMDCIDSTMNSTRYLKFLQQLELIVHHELLSPAYRSPFLMGQHWAAQIRERNSGRHYAVDSWQTDNGQVPVIQDIEQWRESEPAAPLQ